MELPVGAWMHIASLLPVHSLAALEAAANPAFLWGECPKERAAAAWSDRLRTDFPGAPTPCGEEPPKQRYVEYATAAFALPTKKGSLKKASCLVKLKEKQCRGLSTLLRIDGEAFVIWRLRTNDRRRPPSGCWPLVGLLEESELGHSYLVADRANCDISEDERIWSISLLDNWVWCRNYYVRAPQLLARGNDFDDVEIGVAIQHGEVSFFRRDPGTGMREAGRWNTTGVVGRYVSTGGSRSTGGARFDGLHNGMHGPTRFVRPVVIGSEDGKVEVTFLGIYATVPFTPPPCSEALSGLWTYAGI